MSLYTMLYKSLTVYNKSQPFHRCVFLANLDLSFLFLRRKKNIYSMYYITMISYLCTC